MYPNQVLASGLNKKSVFVLKSEINLVKQPCLLEVQAVTTCLTWTYLKTDQTCRCILCKYMQFYNKKRKESKNSVVLVKTT